ncbi:hypothetical protein FRX31_027212 [Thalictrum thalictroides]|uniref:Uncharacterized protein n=1 Tax=Thalictrum thalictroides TaxID=46969 RepID=A0A7J6VES5_THATH|nr:hypothetical protein FRX31_027212 [Thalictrum thalictroides]
MPYSDPSCLYSPAHATGECSTYKEWVDNESDSTPTSHAPHLLVRGPSDQTLQSPTSTHAPHLLVTGPSDQENQIPNDDINATPSTTSRHSCSDEQVQNQINELKSSPTT